MRRTTAAPAGRVARPQAAPTGSGPLATTRPPASVERDDLREQVLLSEAVHLIMPDTTVCGGEPPLAPAVTELWPADLARLVGIALDRRLRPVPRAPAQQCASAGFTPRIAFTTDDFVAAQALVTAGLGVTLLPGLALRAARNPGVRTARLRGTRRCVVAVRYGEPPDPPATAVLLDALRAAAAPAAASRPDPSAGAARGGRRAGSKSAACLLDRAADRGRSGSSTAPAATRRPSRCIGFSTK